MLKKMREYASAGNYRDALIIGQNLFNHNPGDEDVFEAYFAVLWNIISEATTSKEKRDYAQQLTIIVSAFSENVELNDGVIELIKSKEESVSILYADIQELENAEIREYTKTRLIHNDELLVRVEKTMQQLQKVTEQEQFESILKEIQEIDNQFDKDYLSDRQKAKYESDTRKCSQIVDEKLRSFEHQKNVAYNLQALEAYEKVYRYFKENKVTDDHKAIIQGLFEFDATKLFNETLTYYNHVYGYVLSKLSDDDKFVLTKAAIRTETRK